LKKALIWSIVAVVLGLLVTLTPLIISTEVETGLRYAMVPEAYDGAPLPPNKSEEVWGLSPPKYSIADFGVLLASFAVASVVYVFFKHKGPGS